jgi:hypothetical protein
MRSCRAFVASFLACTVADTALAEPPALPPAGAYEVEVRIEIPNVGGWSWQGTSRVCLPHARAGGPPFPVLSANNPFAACRVGNLEQSGTRLEYDILCEGRGAARAHAAYTILPDGFSGRIAIVLGAKNMTMRELQAGRRVGDCDENASREVRS